MLLRSQLSFMLLFQSRCLSLSAVVVPSMLLVFMVFICAFGRADVCMLVIISQSCLCIFFGGGVNGHVGSVVVLALFFGYCCSLFLVLFLSVTALRRLFFVVISLESGLVVGR